MRGRRGVLGVSGLVGLVYVVVCLAVAAPAFGLSSWWHMTSSVRPAVLHRGEEGLIGFEALNVGDATVHGEACINVAEGAGQYANSECTELAEPGVLGRSGFEKNPNPNPAIVFTATLPEGVTVKPVSSENPGPDAHVNDLEDCVEPQPRHIRCVFEALAVPFASVELTIGVEVGAGAVSGLASAEVTGGGTPAVSVERVLMVGEGATPFGVEEDGFSVVPEEEGGGVDAQAGAHPFQLTTTFALNQNAPEELSGLAGQALHPPALPRDLTFSLPPGLVANAVLFPRCSELDFLTKSIATTNFGDACPEDTAVGVVGLTIDEPAFGGLKTLSVPVFNLVPAQGEPVRFGFYVLGASVPIDFHIRTGEDYGATATVDNITQVVNFVSESLTIWGVPGEAAHNESRGWGCVSGREFAGPGSSCTPTSEPHPPPFLTLPTSCAEPFEASVTGLSWPHKNGAGVLESTPLADTPQTSYSLQDEFARPIGLTGCNELSFAPFIEVAPDVENASTSTGLKVDVRVPQEVSENASGLASSSVRDITVALPAGVVINPADGNGLEACSEGQIGYTGEKPFSSVPGTSLLTFTATLDSPFCPDASKIATVEIHSPLIKSPLVGAVYLAAQNDNPFGSLVANYIVAEDKEAGVLVKLPGKVSLCQGSGETISGQTCAAAGQIIATFENNPQLPFEDAELHFFGGERAPLATPAHCGVYETHAMFTPWSATPAVPASSSFAITAGPKTPAEPNGSPCPASSLPFTPSLTGGTTNINAGSFSPLSTTISRQDGQQDMQSVTLHMPAGLEGILAGVTLCPEEQANNGTCGPESLIGETTVEAGVGNDPVSVKGGKVYITEKYAGAPFGLSIVNPVKAGPFDLEHDSANPNQQPPCDCLVVRAKIEVDPTSAELTVTTDPSGPHAIPHFIDGIPVQIKAVNVTVNRAAFTFNPTNCDAMSITGTITSDENTTSPVAVPFQTANCSLLAFTPTLKVTTGAHPSKQDGTNLTFNISYPKNPMGHQSWFKAAKFDIPKQLPARLTTLQKACLSAVFETNPAACPQASVIGQATVHTPVLPVPLTGPVYFVSHGGAKFPDAVIVLQGYGITVRLRGETNIKNGVTSATFRNTPDVPFENIQVTIPAGPHSEFATNLPPTAHNTPCGQKLTMPTSLQAQNGQTIHQNTPITITGCPTKHTTKKKKKK